MKEFSLVISLLTAILLFNGCNSDSSTTKEQIKIETKICPQCNMELPKSNIHTAQLNKDGEMIYFDDVGCMVLWTKDNNIDLKTLKPEVFSNDSKKFIDAFSAYYMINEKTPMMYGFSAYENTKDGAVSFDEVTLRMLRGEHMANPKIRKQILGY